MCSIFGIFDIKEQSAQLRQVALENSRLQLHRGPDWEGIYQGKNAIIVHERLSIVDPQNGAQPLYNENKTHILAVNGEIYNQRWCIIKTRNEQKEFSWNSPQSFIHISPEDYPPVAQAYGG